MQDSLFPEDEKPEHGLARREDPPTAKKAAKSIETTGLQKIVEDILKGIYPNTMNSDEVWRSSGKRQNSITPRFATLKQKGIIRELGTRPGECGSDQIAYQWIPPAERLPK